MLSHTKINIFFTLALLVFLWSPAWPLDIPITVQEPAGISRVGEQVTSGIPLPPGTQTSTWSLWNGTQEVPLQKTLLPGRTPWILLDFQLDLPASGKASLTLRDTAPSVQPASPLSIAEDSSSIVVVTGPLKVLIQKNPFNLLETAWWDSDGNGIFDPAEVVASSAGSNIQLVDSTSGNSFTGDGPPDLIAWEYKGPVRSTLRVDGRYRNAGTEFLAYTTRITFYAGKGYIKIDHVLRNSIKENERHVKVRSATLKFGDGTASIRATRSGSITWSNINSTGSTFEIVPTSLWGIDTTTNGGMLLPDLSYHGATWVADFTKGLSSAEQTRRTGAVKSPLFALAPSGNYSEYGELSVSKFGTLDDEKLAYQKWGWSWTSSQEPTDPHNPDYSISWRNVAVHDDLEADDVWQNLTMYLRTGSRGYWDRAMGWARYYKWDYTFRTDGFDYAWDSNWESPAYSRPNISIPMTATDTSYLNADVNPGRIDIISWGGDHLFGWGLIDYYLLTGDLDALDAARDIGEVSERVYGWRSPGYSMSYYGQRQGGRQLLFTTRLYEITGETRWKNLMDHIADLWLQTPDWNSSMGMYVAWTGEVGGFQIGALSHGMERYYQATGNSTIKNRLIAMADWVSQYGLDNTYQYSGSYVTINGQHNYFATPPLTYFDPIPTEWWIDTLVRGYRMTGNIAYLARAKYFWDRGSKVNFGVPITRFAGDNQVGYFLSKRFNGANLYVGNGDLPYAIELFYEASRQSVGNSVKPAAPRGLKIY